MSYDYKHCININKLRTIFDSEISDKYIERAVRNNNKNSRMFIKEIAETL